MSKEQRLYERPTHTHKSKDPDLFVQIKKELLARPLTADDLLDRTDVARSTLYLYLADLLSKKEIRKRGKPSRRPGRREVVFELAPEERRKFEKEKEKKGK